MRLTKAIREQILNDLLNHAFGAQDKALDKVENELADEVYLTVYTPEEIAFMEKVGSSGFFTKSRMGYSSKDFGWGELRLSQPQYVMPTRRELKLKGGALAQKISAYRQAHKTHGEVRRNARSEAEGILNSAQTTKRLIEVWPEITAFVPKDTTGATNLPALQVEKLNQVLGVPPTTKENDDA